MNRCDSLLASCLDLRRKRRTEIGEVARFARDGLPIFKVAKRYATKVDEAITFQGIPIIVDRPLGFVQEGTDPAGAPWRRLYRYDYGFIPNTEGGDGEGVDVFLGPSADAPMSWWAIQMKNDGAFDEYKVMIGFSSERLALACYRMHIPARLLAATVAIPIAMIKSMLGLEPGAVIQA